jgi:hypothetical protein
MASIDNLKTLLNHTIYDGQRKKYSCYINDDNTTDKSAIFLFYNNDNGRVSETNTVAPYYRNQVQVVVRHISYDLARNGAFEALEYINARRKQYTGLVLKPVSTPVYLGRNSIGSYNWGFFVDMKGAK